MVAGVGLAFITAVVGRTAAAEPYNFFEPSEKTAVSQSKPPLRSSRSQAQTSNRRENHNKGAAAEKNTTPRTLVVGSPSIGVETTTAVKRRSLHGEEADPERDLNMGPVRQNLLPPFLGLSLTAPFSW